MGFGLVKSIFVRKDGVYLTSKSDNDGAPFKCIRIDGLSEVYEKDGQSGLDAAILEMFDNYAVPYGHHKSVERYRRVFNHPSKRPLREAYLSKINERYAQLSDADKQNWGSEAFKAYKAYSNQQRAEYYGQLADLCRQLDEEYDE